MKKFRRFLGKWDTLAHQFGWMHDKTYSGRIKPTKGLSNLHDPRTKPISRRIVRAKIKRETMKDINEL